MKSILRHSVACRVYYTMNILCNKFNFSYFALYVYICMFIVVCGTKLVYNAALLTFSYRMIKNFYYVFGMI